MYSFFKAFLVLMKLPVSKLLQKKELDIFAVIELVAARWLLHATR